MSVPTRHVTSPSPIHQANKALSSPLGTASTRYAWSGSDDNGHGCHPAFALAEHYRAHDRSHPGYTENRYRGDHMSISFTEGGGIFVLDVNVHNGAMSADRIGFP